MKRISIIIAMMLLVGIAQFGYASHSRFSSIEVKMEDSNNGSDSPVLEVQDLNGTSLFKIDEDGNIYTGVDMVVREQWLAPIAKNYGSCTATSLIDTVVLYSNTVTISLTTQPAYPRNITWQCTESPNAASSNPGNTIYITVYGINAMGNYVSENIQAGTTTITTSSNSGVGNVAFSKVNTITFSTGFLATFNNNVGSVDSYSIGVDNKFGLSHDPYGDTVFKVIENAANVNATSVTINGTYHTYTPSGTPNASMNLEIWYRTRQLTINP
jgi:hypothetical protein